MKISINYKVIFRRLVCFLLIVFTAAVQSTWGAKITVGSARALLLIPLVVAVSMHEKSIPSMLFALLAGAIWDSTSITTDGFFSLCTVSVGFVVCMLCVFVMRNNIFSCMLLSVGAIFAVCTLYWLFFILIKGYDNAAYIYFSYYFPSVFFTAVFTPLYYGIIHFLFEKTAPERKRINY